MPIREKRRQYLKNGKQLLYYQQIIMGAIKEFYHNEINDGLCNPVIIEKEPNLIKLFIVLEVTEGCINDPVIFSNPESAESLIEEMVITKGFRARKDKETFSNYSNAFNIWEDSNECTYDPMDWEILIWSALEIKK